MSNNTTKIRVCFEGNNFYPETINLAVNTQTLERVVEIVGGLNRVASILKQIKEKLVAVVPEYAVADVEYLAKEKEAVYAHSVYELRLQRLNSDTPITAEDVLKEQANLAYVAAKDTKHDAFMTAVIADLPNDAFFVQNLLGYMPPDWISSKNCNVPEFFIE